MTAEDVRIAIAQKAWQDLPGSSEGRWALKMRERIANYYSVDEASLGEKATNAVSPRRSRTAILERVTNLGDEYSPAEARTNRVFDRLTSRLIGAIMSSAESAATAVADQLVKAKAEIDAVIAELKDQSVSDATVARLQNLAQALDDVNPDAPADPPAEEPPVDQPPAEEPVADGATDTSE